MLKGHKSQVQSEVWYPVFAGLWGGRPDTAATRGEGGDNAGTGRPAGRAAGPSGCAGGGSTTGDGSGA